MTPVLDLRIIILDAVCRAQKLPDSAERTTTLDHLRFAARALLPLVQAEENDTMLQQLRDRDTLPTPAPSDPFEERQRSRPMPYDYEPPVVVTLDAIPPPPVEPSDVASHWSLTHE